MVQDKTTGATQTGQEPEQVKTHGETSAKATDGAGEGKEKLSNIEIWRATLTEEEQRENARRAGKASAIARYKKGLIRQACQTVMASSIEDEDLSAACEKMGVENSFAYATAIAIGRKALAGDAEAARYLRDTAGEKPREAVDMAIDKPIQARDMSEVSDEELVAMAESLESGQ